ncbi:MAG: hypothetical protein QM754_09065 [Tepidisphaeraceae bacterium]
MPRDFFPHRDSELEQWIVAFDKALSIDPASYGVPADEAEGLSAAVERFTTAYATTMKPSTRTSIAILEKDNARGDMIRQLRVVVRYVQAWPGTDDAKRMALGLPVRDAAVRRGDEALAAPRVDVDGVDGVSIDVSASAPALRRRGRPGRGASRGSVRSATPRRRRSTAGPSATTRRAFRPGSTSPTNCRPARASGSWRRGWTASRSSAISPCRRSRTSCAPAPRWRREGRPAAGG